MVGGARLPPDFLSLCVCWFFPYIWRKLFPTRVVEIRLLDSNRNTENIVTIHLDRKDGKKIVDLIEEATLEDNAKK